MPDSLISRVGKVQIEHWIWTETSTGDLRCAGCDLRTDSPELAATHAAPQILQEFQRELDRLRQEWRTASEDALEAAKREEILREARSPDGFPVPGNPSDGHTFHISVSTRSSFSISDDDEHYQDSLYWDSPMERSVRAWSLPAALRAAIEGGLAPWGWRGTNGWDEEGGESSDEVDTSSNSDVRPKQSHEDND